MQIQEIDELVTWFNANVLNSYALNTDLDIVATKKETNALTDDAQLYKWCPRRKKLVRSHYKA